MAPIEPITEVIPRRGRGTQPAGGAQLPPADWEMVSGELRKGSATSWLATVGRDGSPHVRPVFAAWTGSSFVVASKHDAVKSRNMRADGRATITTDIGFLHIVVEGLARRVTDRERLQLASRTMQEVFTWPTEVVGEELDAEYGAPTSGGPPYEVYEMHPLKAFGFPTQDTFEPTRWTFPPR
ncbi:pyridoxamine 5'-phosphate oxidase family protein [Streptomyces sp. NBC_00467]|uniref:pyridoxamine 5'-phosphate oxidase family protein n=1 Tax=Streptomyces sp. NBC_00467 TaxID=2975752 RepID=UPI002E1831BF